MKQKLKQLMFDEAAFFETAFRVKGGTTISIGDTFPANQDNAIPARPNDSQYVAVSRIGQACEKSPAFQLKGYDAKGAAYGTLYVAGEEAKWRCDGQTVWTTASVQGEENALSDQEIIRTALFPVVAWYEPQSEYMKGFREKYQKNEATTNECIRFSSAFEYEYVANNNEVEVIFDCHESLCSPRMGTDVVTEKENTTETNLPWQQNLNIPNDLSVASAIAGKYALNGNWGVVTEGSLSYDFRVDMVNPNELTEYVDNAYFRDAMQQIVGYIGSIFRNNNLKWDGTPINEFLEKHNVTMTGSNQQNIMLVGDPGTGKTLLSRMVSAAFGLPCLVFRLHARSEKDELTQEVVATDHGFDTLKALVYWFVKHGGVLVFDDLSNADANMFFSIVGGLLESPYEYVVNQQKVKRHPLCIIMATSNIGTIGSQDQNEALLTRFGTHLVVDKISDEEFKACIISRAQSNSGVKVKEQTQKAIANWTYSVFTAVSNAIKAVDIETASKLITLRAAISTAEKILNAIADGFEIDANKAAKQTMANILYTGGNPALQRAVSDAIDSAPAFKM